MPDNRVQVDIVAENRQLRAKLADSEAQIAAFKLKSEDGVASVGAGFEKSTRAARLFRSAIGYIAFPLVLVETAKTIANKIQDAIEKTRLFKEEVAGLTKNFKDASKASQIAVQQGPAAANRNKELEEELRLLGELQEKLQKAIGSEASARRRAVEEVQEGNYQNANLEATVLQIKLNNIDKEEGARRRAVEEEIRGVREAGRKRREAEEELRTKPIRESLEERIAQARIQGAENNPELRAKLELEQKKHIIEIEFAKETNAAVLALRDELLQQLDNLDAQSRQRRKDAELRQLRELLAEFKKAQSEGFTIKDLNTANIGSGSALQVIGQQLPALVTLAGGGR